MTPSDELKQAALVHLRRNISSIRNDESVFRDFSAGAAYQDPIARREERERILELLRSREAGMDCITKDGSLKTPEYWADWLEEKLK